VADDLKLMETASWSKKLGPFPPNKLPYKLQGVKGRFLQVEVFMQASKNKVSPTIVSLSAKGKTIILN
jgi:hypothetical protein